MSGAWGAGGLWGRRDKEIMRRRQWRSRVPGAVKCGIEKVALVTFSIPDIRARPFWRRLAVGAVTHGPL